MANEIVSLALISFQGAASRKALAISICKKVLDLGSVRTNELFNFMKIAQKYSLITKIGRIVVFLALPLATLESAQAIIFVENLSETQATNLTIGSGITDQGSSFTTNGNNYSLNSVTARLEEFSEGIFSINLHTDNSGEPGTVIEQLNTAENILPGGFNNYLFTPSNSVNLDANTTYWLIGSTTSPGFYTWRSTTSFNQTGVWTIGDGRVFSTDEGSSWAIFSNNPAQLSVDADVAAAVPFEFSPAIGILLISGLLIAKAGYGKHQVNKVKESHSFEVKKISG